MLNYSASPPRIQATSLSSICYWCANPILHTLLHRICACIVGVQSELGAKGLCPAYLVEGSSSASGTVENQQSDGHREIPK